MAKIMSDAKKFEKIKDIVDAIMQSNGYREDHNCEWLGPRLNEIIDIIDAKKQDEFFFKIKTDKNYPEHPILVTIIDHVTVYKDDVKWLLNPNNKWRWDLYERLIFDGPLIEKSI